MDGCRSCCGKLGTGFRGCKGGVLVGWGPVLPAGKDVKSFERKK